MKKIFTLLLCSALFAGSCWGGTETTKTIGGDTQTTSKLPIYQGAQMNFLCQMIYTATEIKNAGGGAGTITKIGFKYKSSSAINARSSECKIYIGTTSSSSYSNTSFLAAGTQVYTGYPALSAGEYSIDITDYAWNGTDNLVITIWDNNNTRVSMADRTHYGYDSENKGLWKSGGTDSKITGDITGITGTKVSIIPQLYLTFSGAPTPTYDKPTDVSVTSKTSSSATIGWSKKDSAVIKLEYKLSTAESWTLAKEDIAENSYTISGLTASTGYKYQVTAVYPTGSSEAVSGTFTTDDQSDHIHDGAEFKKWESTTALPSDPGNYYLNGNVSVSSWTVPTGDTKICLNGKTITFSSGYITIGNGKSLSIYDNEGNGAISVEQAFFPTIKVNGGTLSLYGGAINNTASSSNSAYAIDVTSGTFNIKGNVKMSTGSSAANVYLRTSTSVVTLIGAITNTTKLSVNKAANSNITSGWSTQMGSADPADFFSSKNSDAPSVILVSGEAQLGVPSVTISETGTNTFTAGGPKNVNLVRTFQAGILNTISLPFALTDAQLQEKFGSDYELYELGSSSLTNGVLSLMFNKVTALDDGYPYLLRISSTIENPSFSSVYLTTENHTKTTTAVKMVAVISEKNITNYESVLFLNAAGELNWSTAAGNFKGMRAYFQLNSGSPSAISARRIVLGTTTPTNLQGTAIENKIEKKIVNGQMIILKDGVKYSVQGQIIK